MNRRILITNDDGISAAGIRKLASTAGRFGDVTVVAPDSQRSAASHHCIFSSPLTLKKYDFGMDGVKAYSLNGTPADCARFGIMAVMDTKPDIVLSGINHGYNIASDIQYSGTVGAALEASFLGVQAIAVSAGSLDNLDIIDQYLPALLEEYMNKPLPNNRIWNINFPACTLAECKGIMKDAKMYFDHFYDDRYYLEAIDDESWTAHNAVKRIWEAPEGTDLYAMINNYISVGPVTNLT